MLNRIVISIISLLLGKTETMLLLARVLEKRGRDRRGARDQVFGAMATVAGDALKARRQQEGMAS